MSGSAIETFYSVLSFKFDESKFKKFSGLVDKSIKSLAVMATAITGVTASAFYFTKRIAANNDILGKFAQITDVGLTNIQEFEYGAKIAGSSVNSMRSAISGLTQNIGAIATGTGGAVDAFGRLGISVIDAKGDLKKADDVFMEVSHSIHSLGSQAEKLRMLGAIGIDASLLLFMDQSAEAIRQQLDAKKELGYILSKQDVGAAAYFNDRLIDILTIIKGISDFVGTNLMKKFSSLMYVFERWFIDNKKLIYQDIGIFLMHVGHAVAFLYRVTGRAIGVINGIAQALGGWHNTIVGVTAVLMALNASALLLPLLVTAGALGLGLIIEDVLKYANAGDSVLGGMVEGLDKLKLDLYTIPVLMSPIGVGVSFIIKKVLELFAATSKLQWISNEIKNIGENIQKFIIKPIQIFLDSLKLMSPAALGLSLGLEKALQLQLQLQSTDKPQKPDNDFSFLSLLGKVSPLGIGISHVMEQYIVPNFQTQPSINTTTATQKTVNVNIHDYSTESIGKVKSAVVDAIKGDIEGASMNVPNKGVSY